MERESALLREAMAAGEGDPEEVMQAMLQVLFSKERLLDPLQRVAQELRLYLQQEQEKVGADGGDRDRLESLLRGVESVCAAYERGAEVQEVVRLMEEVGQYGDPPAQVLQRVPEFTRMWEQEE